MREKLLKLMQSEGLTPSQLADALGVRPSNISHLISGRNKPGFEFLQRLFRRFPQLDPDWLLLDSERMYRPGYDKEAVARFDGGDLPERVDAEDTVKDVRRSETASAGERTKVSEYAVSGQAATLFDPVGEDSRRATEAAAHTVSEEPAAASQGSVAQNGISSSGRLPVRVVVLYEDGTFEDYRRR